MPTSFASRPRNVEPVPASADQDVAADLDGEPATLTVGFGVYRIGSDGKLDFVRKYGVETGSQTPFWSVWYRHSGLAGPDRAIRAKITGFWGGEAASG